MKLSNPHPTHAVYDELLLEAANGILTINIDELSEIYGVDGQLWQAALMTIFDLLSIDRQANLALNMVGWLHDQLRDHEIAMPGSLTVDVYDLWQFLHRYVVPIEIHMFRAVLDFIGHTLHGEEFVGQPHAHLFTASRDCDGPHEHEISLYLQEEHHPAGRFNVHDLISKMLPTSETFSYDVDEDHGADEFTATWSHSTDEGWTRTTVGRCTDRFCTVGMIRNRDRFAEAAGF